MNEQIDMLIKELEIIRKQAKIFFQKEKELKKQALDKRRTYGSQILVCPGMIFANKTGTQKIYGKMTALKLLMLTVLVIE